MKGEVNNIGYLIAKKPIKGWDMEASELSVLELHMLKAGKKAKRFELL